MSSLILFFNIKLELADEDFLIWLWEWDEENISLKWAIELVDFGILLFFTCCNGTGGGRVDVIGLEIIIFFCWCWWNGGGGVGGGSVGGDVPNDAVWILFKLWWFLIWFGEVDVDKVNARFTFDLWNVCRFENEPKFLLVGICGGCSGGGGGGNGGGGGKASGIDFNDDETSRLLLFIKPVELIDVSLYFSFILNIGIFEPIIDSLAIDMHLDI